jgi:hypothetical protein
MSTGWTDRQTYASLCYVPQKEYFVWTSGFQERNSLLVPTCRFAAAGSRPDATWCEASDCQSRCIWGTREVLAASSGRWICTEVEDGQLQCKILWWIRRYFRNNRCYATATIKTHTSVATKTYAYRYLGNCLDNRDRIVEFPQQRYTLAKAASKTRRTLGQGVLSAVRKIYLRR